MPFLLLVDEVKMKEGKLTATNIFDEVEVSELPTLLPEFHLCMGLLGEEEDEGETLTLKIRSKNLKKNDVDFPYQHGRDGIIKNVTVKIAKLPISETETIFFEVSFRKKLIGKYPLTIKKVGDH
ncbi:hypothetical protein [Paenibacillus sp. yr247]|uniref:DUF6941 family protein n=1 Tax=Paenibacillus sp. yr247 TaxID=1761880 RepID=UPI001C3180A6|nr:hypothetical protein [Paenibacillus sp. yr247]